MSDGAPAPPEGSPKRTARSSVVPVGAIQGRIPATTLVPACKSALIFDPVAQAPARLLRDRQALAITTLCPPPEQASAEIRTHRVTDIQSVCALAPTRSITQWGNSAGASAGRVRSGRGHRSGHRRAGAGWVQPFQDATPAAVIAVINEHCRASLNHCESDS